MKFGLFGLHRDDNVDPDVMGARARLAEAAGFESLWVGDHIALPVEMGRATGHHRFEAVVALTYLAALTDRVRVAAGVIVLPQRQPVLLAKQLTSLDVLSGGRLIVGVGAGHIEPELRALGVDPAERGARTDEFLDALRVLWEAGGSAAEAEAGSPAGTVQGGRLAGRFVSFADVVQLPAPAQRPHPPIVIGGTGPAALRRAVTRGSGWYGWDHSPDDTARALDALRRAADRYERPAALGELEITVTPSGRLTPGAVRRYADLGVHRLVVIPDIGAGQTHDELIDTVGERLIGLG